ncbi:hypothetical protein WICPIJ_001599 [Wickerhamomyces pijperi]|uniref:RAVE complex protein Rav1 C-terminal domain-containing protein n=1 Tax=Wickerhamomyces pijperi TaxID=599730 RepID=A0A9P8QAI4_WICPI|nr:hypothetical protein WICPIJ_001599 [Wickerhamomyces pijperi]
MTFSFLPGKPSVHPQSTAQCRWKEHHIVAYTSGNNLIILTRSNLSNMQTIYLESDATAVSINAKYGYIAVCMGAEVRVYEPEYQVMKKPRWKFLSTLNEDKFQERKKEEADITRQNSKNNEAGEEEDYSSLIPEDKSVKTTVSWTSKDEILVGSNEYLTIWQFVKLYGHPETDILWRQKQSSPVYLADISQTGEYVVSCGAYDTLPRIWYRTSLGTSTRLSLMFYHLPSYVTGLRFKKRDPLSIINADENLNVDNSEETKSATKDYTDTLYLIDADQELHIVSCGTGEMTSVPTLKLRGSIKLNFHIKDSEGLGFVNVIDEYLVSEALANISKKVFKEELPDLKVLNLDLLIIGSSSNPNISHICTLEHISSTKKRPKISDVTKLVDFQTPTAPEFPIYSDSIIDDSGLVSTVCHDIASGSIQNVTLDLSFLLSPPSKSDDTLKLGSLTHSITGHVKSIQSLTRTSDGSALLTTSRFEENAVWVPRILENGVTTLSKKSSVATPHPITKAVLLEEGNLLITMCPQVICLWDTSKEIATEVFRLSTAGHEDLPICFTSLPSGRGSSINYTVHYLIAVYQSSTRAFMVTSDKITTVKVGDLHKISPNIYKVAAIDTVTSNLSKHHRPIISTIDDQGALRCFTATYKKEFDEIRFSETHYLETEIKKASYIRGSSIGKFAIAQDKALSVWDLNTKLCEYREVFTDNIKDIDWSGTPFDQSILAVGFDKHCLLYTQLRYDYTNQNPSYLAIKKIDISGFTTHSIGDSIWLTDAIFVIGSGNQLYVNDKNLNLVDDAFTKMSIGSRNIGSDDNILSLCCVLNGPVPLYHPQILIQSLFQGKIETVKEILLRLFLKIREVEMKSEDIGNVGSFFGFDIQKFWGASTDKQGEGFPEPYSEFNSDIADLLKEKLSLKYSLPYLTRHQQITLINTIEAVLLIEQNKLQLDSNGLKFFLAVKLTQLSLGHGSSTKKLSNRDISWALHSENKELLLFMIRSSALKASETNFNWSTTVRYGIAHWARHEDLLKLFEEVAKKEFTSDPENRDPTKCAIFYLALKKKQILMALWKTSYSHPEQQKMMAFLKNDFRQERWRKAALKNAFVLLSKQRHMDAACFFLLAGSLKDCANVLIRQIKDWDLAVGVCRVYEGDNGPVLSSILQTHFLERGVQTGDRWLTSYVFWKSKAYTRAIQALIKSPVDVLTEDERQKINVDNSGEDDYDSTSKTFLEDDPLLIILYQQLREKSEVYFKGSLEIDSKLERDFLVRVSRIYSRMGCDYLSVDLMRNWKFLNKDVLFQRLSDSTPTSASTNATLLDTDSFAKFGFSPKLQRRASVLGSYQQEQTHSIPHSSSSSSTATVKSNDTHTMSILEKYGLSKSEIKSTTAQDTSTSSSSSSDVISKIRSNEHEDDHQEKKSTKFTPPPQSAFEEPDMSAFNFGF